MVFDSIPTVVDVLYLVALMDDADIGSRSAQCLIPYFSACPIRRMRTSLLSSHLMAIAPLFWIDLVGLDGECSPCLPSRRPEALWPDSMDIQTIQIYPKMESAPPFKMTPGVNLYKNPYSFCFIFSRLNAQSIRGEGQLIRFPLNCRLSIEKRQR